MHPAKQDRVNNLIWFVCEQFRIHERDYIDIELALNELCERLLKNGYCRRCGVKKEDSYKVGCYSRGRLYNKHIWK